MIIVNINMLDFESDQHFWCFDISGTERKKELVKYVRVRVEVEV